MWAPVWGAIQAGAPQQVPHPTPTFPLVKETPYWLWPSSHNRIIPRADNRFCHNFIIRMLFKEATIWFSAFVDILDFVHVLFHSYFVLELYFEQFSCHGPASARRLIKNLLTYLLNIELTGDELNGGDEGSEQNGSKNRTLRNACFEHELVEETSWPNFTYFILDPQRQIGLEPH